MLELSLMELSGLEQTMLEALCQEDAEGNPISEEEQARIIENFIDASDAFKSKVDRYCDLIDAFACRASFQEDCASRYSELARRNQSVADKLKARLKAVMEMRGEVKIETDNHKLTLVNNGGKAPLIVPQEWRYDATKAPEQFHKRRIELDVIAIRATLEAGEAVEGCAIAERGKNLRII